MTILFTICGRAGSKGLKNKNLKLLNGVPIVYYTLAAIRLYADAHKDDEITVALNTDSRELKEIIKKQDIVRDIIIVDRSPEQGGDLVPKVDVIKTTWEHINKEVDCVIDLDITSPMRRLKDIENAIDTYNSGVDLDLVFSVADARRSPYFNMVEKKSDGRYRKVCDSDFVARQQAPKCYDLNASIYVYNPQFLSKKIDRPILNYRFDISIMPDYRVLDIDSEEDFCLMEVLMNYFTAADPQLSAVCRTAAK